MSRQYCFLCASDEGVFLDITDDNKKLFHEQFTICSLDTVPKVDQLPTKICHKCAYELNQCSSFVSKYKRITLQKRKIRKNCCSLCFESVKKEHVFDLSEDTLKHNLFHKIQRLFNNEFEKFEEACELVCLSCRYTVDVLFDLKNLSQEIAYNLRDIINKEIDYSNFPKINTAVISRKTTITDSARTALYTLQDSDTELSKMTRTRSQKNKVNDTNSSDKPKLKICEKCQSTFKTTNNTSRSKKSAGLVCKSCLAETGSDTNDINKQQSVTETKFCKVFLKDVLKDETVSNQNLYKVKEDGEGKKKYIVTDKVLPEENSKTQGEKSPKIVNDIESNAAKQGQKRTLRSMRTENTDNKEIANKRLRSNVKQKTTDSKSTSLTETFVKRPNLRGQKIDKRNTNQRPDSDSTLTNNVNEYKRKLTKHKRATDASLSDADVDNNPDRKKLKSILAGNIVIKNLNPPSSVYERLRKKSIKFVNPAPIMIDLTNRDVTEESSRRKELALKSKPSSIKKTSEKSDDSESDNKETEDDKSETYTCEECGANHETKLTWLSHKLTHYKQPKLELEKVNVDDTTKDTVSTKEAVEDLCEDQSETIAIRVDDDEEEAVTDATNLDTSVTTEKIQSSMKESNEIVDVESVSDDHDSDHGQQTENKVEKSQSQEDAETTVTKSTPEKVKRSSRKSGSRKRLYSPRSRRRSRKITNQNIDKKEDKSETENNSSTEEDMTTLPVEDENVRTKENEDISLTPIKNGQAKENEDNLLVQNEKNLDNEQNKDEEENVERTTEERPAVLESEQKETQKDDDVDGEKETAETQDESEIVDKETNDKESDTDEQEDVAKDKESETNDKESEAIDNESETIDKESETIDKESETNDKESETIDKESETNDRESEINDKESETNDKESETNDKESETNDKESETNDKESETNDKESETNDKESETNDKESETIEEESEAIVEESEAIVKESEATDKESSNGVKSSKDCSDESPAKDVAGSSKTVKRKCIEVEDSSDEDIRIVNVNSSKKTAKEKSSDRTENVDSSSEDEIECTQIENDKPLVTKEVIVLSETNSSACNDDVEEVEIREQKKSAKDSADAAAEVLQEVLDLASAEVEKRNETVDDNTENDSADMETLENISREIRNSENASPLKLNSSQTTVTSS